MSFDILDPTFEGAPPALERPPRPRTLAGAVVGFISNGKEGTKGFFAHLERMLTEEFGVARVEWRTKGNYSAPAEAAILADAADWDLAVTGLGD